MSQQVNAVLLILRPAAGACLIAIQNMGLASWRGGGRERARWVFEPLPNCRGTDS